MEGSLCVGTTSAETWRWMWISVLIKRLYVVKESYSTSVSRIGKFTIYKWWARREQASFRNDWTELHASRPSYHHFPGFCSSTGSMGSHYREMISLQGWTANSLCQCLHSLLPLNGQQLFQINRLNQLSFTLQTKEQNQGGQLTWKMSHS